MIEFVIGAFGGAAAMSLAIGFWMVTLTLAGCGTVTRGVSSGSG